MRRYLGARCAAERLLYASLFALGGAGLVVITYLLVADTSASATATTIPRAIQRALGKCVVAAQTHGGPGALNQCAALYYHHPQAPLRSAAPRSPTC